MYFKKVDQNDKLVKYAKSKRFEDVLIHIAEIISVNVDFDGKNMPIEEYVSICRDIL